MNSLPYSARTVAVADASSAANTGRQALNSHAKTRTRPVAATYVAVGWPAAINPSASAVAQGAR